MHRLNRTQYKNTVRDLLGTSLDPSADLPADDVSYGYDNIAAVLTVSPLHVELYEAAAEELTKEALHIPITATTTHHEAETLEGSIGVATSDAWLLWSNGTVGPTVDLVEGEYKITCLLYTSPSPRDRTRSRMPSSA